MSKQWGKLRRSLVDARARTSQRGRQHWTAAFPRLEAWIMSRPVSASSSGPASEISSMVSMVSGDDFDDNLLVCTPSPLVQQVLVVQTQNGVNMASGMATMAPSTATTAPCTAPLPLTAGPSTIEPIVPIVAQLGAQDTPSVIQDRSLVLSRQCSLLKSTAPCRTSPARRIRHPCRTLRIRHPCRMLPCLLCQQGLLFQWVIMVRALSSLLCLTPIGW